ncbi:hypothetical protein BKA63DRAFT_586612 [Paraphoma chrysanthemicola]|nr:hypothetical protein BKA63DRAFT_586612 [Paraphoma chrysanthemicola]
MVVGDTTFLAAERESRAKTSLAAADGYFDQVVAVSQQMINVGLQKIYEKNQEVMSVFDGVNNYGSISAEIGASQIKIPANIAEAFNVVWLWNFTSGTFTANLPNGEVKSYDVAGWSVAVLVPLIRTDLAHDDKDDEDTKKWKEETRKWIEDNFDVPGDYRPEQLYAKMASARWSDIRFDRGSFTIKGKPVNWDSWSKIPGNADIADSFKMIMGKICREREKSGLTSAGFSFTMDRSIPHDPNRVTYPPKQLQHQSYPYKLPTSSGMTDQAWTTGIESLDDEPGPHNCLLYCELVDDRTFSGAQIPHVGNFTTVGGAGGTPKAINGTFALSHQLIFERFLLPHLQVFVQQSQIYPNQAVFWNEGRTIRSSLSYTVGSYPDKDPNNDPRNEIYKFKRIPPKDGKLAYYEAHVDVTQEGPLFESRDRNEWTKFYAEGSPTVTVSWDAYGKSIKVRGETHYRSHGTTGSTQNVDPTLHQIVPANSWWHGHYEMTWNMSISVEPDGGSLKMVASHDPNFVNIIAYPDDRNIWEWDKPGTHDEIRDRIQFNMNTQLQHFQNVLNAGFTDQLKFTYPGYGQLKFGETYFNNNGDLLAVIDYGDLPAGKVVISRPPVVGSAPPSGGQQIELPGGNTQPPKPTGPRLAWTTNSPLKASVKPATAEKDAQIEVHITGENTGSTPAYFSAFETMLAGHKNPTQALFNVLEFVAVPADANATNVLVSAKITPLPASTAPKVAPTLVMRKKSSRSYTCDVRIAAANGPIVVPAGGKIVITAKGISGDADTPVNMSIREIWSDNSGAISTGDEEGVLAPLVIKLIK